MFGPGSFHSPGWYGMYPRLVYLLVKTNVLFCFFLVIFLLCVALTLAGFFFPLFCFGLVY